MGGSTCSISYRPSPVHGALPILFTHVRVYICPCTSCTVESVPCEVCACVLAVCDRTTCCMRSDSDVEDKSEDEGGSEDHELIVPHDLAEQFMSLVKVVPW